ncbi:dTDP-4-dehydrorhamnose 3,5-epimerase family protein [Mesorhizobium sp. AR10]|uniref:dTDP-4-dehydrorhamnose 3,5-epimerase family protein n=1 Tax=Mesorhizobium sp. AR10 TaxID=2865839 RepID=UPI0039B6EBF6
MDLSRSRTTRRSSTKCTDYYEPDCDRGVRFNDPDLGIEWGITPEAAILSEKDSRAPLLTDIQNPFAWGTTKLSCL